MVTLSRRARYVLGQFGWGLLVMWLVLTVTWGILNALPAERAVGFGTVEMGMAAAYDDPPGPLGLYVDWMTSFLTLEWGMTLLSFGVEDKPMPVLELYKQRLPVTLAYTVPGVVVSVLAGTGLSTYAAIHPGGHANRVLSLLSYGGLSVPAFIAAQGVWLIMPVWLGWVHLYDPKQSLTATQNLTRLSVPAAIVAVNFFAVQVRHAQGETVEYLDAEFVKTVRAKGASRLRIATHVFRNAWPSLASLVLGESLGMLVLMVIVIEEILEIPGMAVAVFRGFAAGDPMLSFTAVFGVVLVGVTGTLARDVGRLLFDPRIEG